MIQSQEKLIDLKDKTVREYEQNMQRLAEDKLHATAALTDMSRRFDKLNEQVWLR